MATSSGCGSRSRSTWSASPCPSLNLEGKILVVGVDRGGTGFIPVGSSTFQDGDHAALIVHKDAMDTLDELLAPVGGALRCASSSPVRAPSGDTWRPTSRARGHAVTLIEQKPDHLQIAREWAPDVELMLGDACEPWVLEKANLRDADVVVAVTGDDEDNLVTALLAKQEFGVPKVLARVNHPGNEWLFTEQWGVDAAVSPPHLLTAMVEEEVTVGDLVRLLPLERGGISIVELTIPGRFGGRGPAAVRAPTAAGHHDRGDHPRGSRGDPAAGDGDGGRRRGGRPGGTRVRGRASRRHLRRTGVGRRRLPARRRAA